MRWLQYDSIRVRYSTAVRSTAYRAHSGDSDATHRWPLSRSHTELLILGSSAYTGIGGTLDPSKSLGSKPSAGECPGPDSVLV